jgi:hypothetical protein
MSIVSLVRALLDWSMRIPTRVPCPAGRVEGGRWQTRPSDKEGVAKRGRGPCREAVDLGRTRPRGGNAASGEVGDVGSGEGERDDGFDGSVEDMTALSRT